MTPAVPRLDPRSAAEQATFRRLLDGLARPGQRQTLTDLRPADGPWATALRVLECLADYEVTFAVGAADRYAQEQLLRRTGSRVAPLAQADFILTDASGLADALRSGKRGTLEYPDASATVVATCGAVGTGQLRLGLSGPGVKGRRALRLRGIRGADIALFQEVNLAYPLGIDLILTDSTDAVGHLVCLPRTVTIKISGENSGEISGSEDVHLS